MVETWIPRIDRRRDLWGFADILAVHPRDRVFLLVQTTSLPNLPARVTKVRQAPAAELWLRAGGRIECHGWTHRPSGWQVKVVEIMTETMQPVVTHRPRRASLAGTFKVSCGKVMPDATLAKNVEAMLTCKTPSS